MTKKFLNQSGMSLIEVMVAAGISGVIALGTMKINENAQKGLRNVSTKAGKDNHINFKIGTLLAESITCTNAFDVDGDGNPEVNPNSPLPGMAPGVGEDLINENFPALIVGANTDVQGIYFNGQPLSSVDNPLPGTNGEYIVRTMTFTRESLTACRIDFDFDRRGYDRNNVADTTTNTYGGKTKSETLYLGCSFTPANQLQGCSSRGMNDLGKWQYRTDGAAPVATEWLENGYDAAVIGVFPGAAPSSSLVIANTANAWNGLVDGVAMQPNHVIRWGDITAAGAGVGIYGDNAGAGDCLNFQFGGNAPHLSSCQSTGTALENGLQMNSGNLAVQAGDISVQNGDVSITNGRFAVGTGTMQINNGGFNMGNGDLTITAGDLSLAAGRISAFGDISSTNGNVAATNEVRAGAGLVSNGTLNVAGVSTLGAAVAINGADVNGWSINASGGGSFGGAIRTSGGLDVGQDLHVGQNLNVDQNVVVTQNLTVNGLNATFTGNVIAGTFMYTSSDARLKTDIQSLEGRALDNILSLNPVSYYWIDKEKRGKQAQLGLIAQEVEKVYPEIVYDREDGTKAVSYGSLISPIIQSVKDLYSMIEKAISNSDENKREIASLKAENKKLKEQNQEMLKRLENLEKRLED